MDCEVKLMSNKLSVDLTESSAKKSYRTPQVHHVGSLDKVRAFIDGRVAEGATSGYYDDRR
jgi:hypothetical protein